MSKLSIKELSEAKAAERKVRYKSGKKMRGIFLRKMLHFIVAAVLKIDQMVAKEKIAIISDRRKPTRGKHVIFACTHPAGNDIQRVLMLHKMIYPLLKLIFKSVRKHKFVYLNKMPEFTSNAIFAVNHSCKNDIPYACEAIGQQCYVLVGKQPLNLIDRLFFNINGTIWVDRKDKRSRKDSANAMVDLLNKGANILIFPEGTWNLTPSKPMLPLYWGIIDVAKQARKPIIPVVLEYSGDTCFVSFGECICVDKGDDKSSKINELTDSLATLKWLLWEKVPNIGYASEYEWLSEMRKRITEYPKLDIKYEMSVIRQIYDTDDFVFKHLADLQASRSNAFLFNKRNHN